MKKIFGAGLILLASMSVSPANAQSSISGQSIKSLGCNDATQLCFINTFVSFGPAGCNAKQTTWDGTTALGKSFFASALTAKVSGSTVKIGYENACPSPNTGLPTLRFLTVE